MKQNTKKILDFIIEETKKKNANLALLNEGTIATQQTTKVSENILRFTKVKLEDEVPDFDWDALLRNSADELAYLFGYEGFCLIRNAEEGHYPTDTISDLQEVVTELERILLIVYPKDTPKPYGEKIRYLIEKLPKLIKEA